MSYIKSGDLLVTASFHTKEVLFTHQHARIRRKKNTSLKSQAIDLKEFYLRC